MDKKNHKQRALVVVGAGASVELGIPATVGFGKLIDDAIKTDRYCVETGGTTAYLDIQDKLQTFYGNPAEAHFERIYHVLHELDQWRLTQGAVAKFRPVMYPFLNLEKAYPESALWAACSKMLDFIYTKVSEVCDRPTKPLAPLSAFFDALEQQYIPRVYTTNYDDFVSQATQERYFTGFTEKHGDHVDFDGQAFWSEWQQPSLFHLHGSIHMGFPDEHRIGDIAWFDDRATARKHSGFTGSGVERMDGTSIQRSAIITGLDKLGRLQQSPYSFYYAGLNRDALEADLILVLGSGLADLHLNTYLKAARRARPDVPILYVGYWGAEPVDFYSTIHLELEERDIALFHELGIDLVNVPEGKFKAYDGWTIDARGKAAVWDSGFQSFLAAPEAFSKVVQELTTK